MVVRIVKSKDIIKALVYNQNKLDNMCASILGVNKIALPLYEIQSPSRYFYSYFEPYLLNNIKTVTPIRHTSLNPNPVDKLDDLMLLKIAKAYMTKIGYSEQPYIIYKHFDLKRIHLHIVSISVNRNGYLINCDFDFLVAQNACKEIIKEFQLTDYDKRYKKKNDLDLKVVDHRESNLTQQIDSVVSSLPKYYSFEDLKSYNAILQLFKVKALRGKDLSSDKSEPVMYCALDHNNKTVSNIVSSSKLSLKVDIGFLEKHFKKSIKTKDLNIENKVSDQIRSYLSQSKDYKHFKKLLTNQGINLVTDNKDKSKFYFVSHKYRRVFSFAHINRQLSNKLDNDPFFNTLLNNSKKKQDPIERLVKHRFIELNKEFDSLKVHPCFEFVDNYYNSYNKAEFVSFFNFLFTGPVDDLDQKQFMNLKKNKRKKKRHTL
ncbi:relaxase/mobilization nuclease domain-containing protein [Myroides odoratimimus]|uniref:relaxase/mobilization nuclease domain-containing protein n=1 Tax=Myroides odoratimimus TaxID=76832 RepID=UPI002DBE1C63|nr:relaxase/mobilization nuclease domain-containing protein [Myroides odoratimimus]MEC4043646.1 relaxase/mobilization nuclease domain-containing protein [Myroides odoratimimus]MEC4151482.1 relaxase/mobilization nuclease domain-containing protein [Myroides odoratimimus]